MEGPHVSFTDAVEEQLERNRSKLRVLHHAATCPHETTPCPAQKHCCAAKRLFVHINQCTQSDCEVPGCKHSRGVWKHYRKCRIGQGDDDDGVCSICSAAPSPYNPASLCERFRVKSIGTRYSVAGDSEMVTVGSYHPTRVGPPLQQGYVRHPSPPPQPTLAIKQSMAKQKGSLIDDGTVTYTSMTVQEEKENTVNATPTSIAGRDPGFVPTSSRAVTPFPPPRTKKVSGVNCVMDAFGTLLGGQYFQATFPEELNEAAQHHQQSLHQYPHQLPSMMETANNHHNYNGMGIRHGRYQQLESPGYNNKHHNKQRFLSLRRNRSRDDGEATEPMIVHQASYVVPSDEDEQEYVSQRQPQPEWYGSKGFQRDQDAAAQTHSKSRGSRIRRMQKRFIA